jgi:hypothetical protein
MLKKRESETTRQHALLQNSLHSYADSRVHTCTNTPGAAQLATNAGCTVRSIRSKASGNGGSAALQYACRPKMASCFDKAVKSLPKRTEVIRLSADRPV